MGGRARELTPGGRLGRAARRLRPALPALLACSVGLLPVPTCLLRIAAGIPCPACGLTRAGLSLLRGDLAAAMGYHPLSLPLAALFAATCVASLFGTDEAFGRLTRRATAAAGVGLVVVWALRFVGAFGGPVAP